MPGVLLVTGHQQVRKGQFLSEFNDAYCTVFRGMENLTKKKTLYKKVVLVSSTFNYREDEIKDQNGKAVGLRCAQKPFTADKAKITGPWAKVEILPILSRLKAPVCHYQSENSLQRQCLHFLSLRVVGWEWPEFLCVVSGVFSCPFYTECFMEDL